jgi:cytochrome c oxidase subunit 2
MLDWLPENVAPFGKDIDWLFYLIYYITGAICVLVMATMLVFLVRYRHRDGRRARYTHGSATVEIVWTVGSALILIILTMLSVPTWGRIEQSLPESDVHIRVTAKQFNWEVTYPGPDGRFDTGSDVTLDNEIHVPVGKPAILHIRSKDVIHALFMPNLRFQQDAVPGREIVRWIQATKAGRYEVPCAELCGFGHSGMKGYLFVHTPDEYTQWLKQIRSS